MVWIITIVLMSIDICIIFMDPLERQYDCLLYTSDAADE